MDLVTSSYLPGDPRLIDQIVYELKSQGIFDQFRKECIADVDTKPAYQNLSQRVEGSVVNFLKKQKFSDDLNKNQLREQLRKSISESGFFETGVERIVDQVVNPKITTVFLPKVEDVVYRFLGLEKPNKDVKPEPKAKVEDLLPNDLEAVSPESEHAKDDLSVSLDEKKEECLDTNSLNSSSNTKTEEDESPPFEPLEENTKFSLHEENSIYSHISDGVSGMASLDSNHSAEIKNADRMEVSQDASINSEGNLSIVTSEEDTKMEISQEQTNGKENNSEQNVTEKEEDCTSVALVGAAANSEDKNDDEAKVSKDDSKRDHDKQKSVRTDKDKKSEKEKPPHRSKSKDSKEHKSKSKDRSRDSEKDNNKQVKKDYDKDKSRDRRSKDGKDRGDKDKSRDKSRSEKDRPKEKSDKDKEGRSKSSKDKDNKSDRDKKDRSSSTKTTTTSSSSSSKDRDKSSSRKDAKERSSSSSTKSSKSSSRDKSKSSSSDKDKKYKDKSHKSSSSSSYKKDKDKKSVDDHYSLKEKRNDRRSTDRDSNDGSGKTSSFTESYAQSHQEGAKGSSDGCTASGSGESSNSDNVEEKRMEEKANDDGGEQGDLQTVQREAPPTVIKYIKPKFASNIHEAMKIMKIRKQLAKLERQNKLALAHVTAVSQQVKLNADEVKLSSDDLQSDKSQHEKRQETAADEKLSVLKGLDLSMENFEALEARLAQEMSNINHNTYGEEDETYECSYVSTSPVKKSQKHPERKPVEQVQRKHVTAEDTLLEEEPDPEEFRGFAGVDLDTSKVNQLNKKIKELTRQKRKHVLEREENVSKKARRGGGGVKNAASTNGKTLFIKISKNYNLDGLNKAIGDVSEQDDSAAGPCHFFDVSNCPSKRHLKILTAHIDKLEKDIEGLTLKIHNNIPNVTTIKKERKRKLVESHNNNSVKSADFKAIIRPISGTYLQDKPPLYNNADEPDSGHRFSLPLSPSDSDKSGEHRREETITVKTKRSGRGASTKRYSSEDLYKPRPMLSCSTSRRRAIQSIENKP